MKKSLETIKKLITQSSEVSNKALGLVIKVDNLNYQKKKSEEIENIYGFESKDKPYGETTFDKIKDETLLYCPSTDIKKIIDIFINNLELYQATEDLKQKSEILRYLKDLSEQLRVDYKEDPNKYIINLSRSKTWHIIEHDFIKTVKKHEIDSFIGRIRLVRTRYQKEINYIKEYYKSQENAYKDMGIARNEKDQEKIHEQYKILSKPLKPIVSELLIDTGNIINNINLVLEDIPKELSNEDKIELEKFLPAISEYYIDQTFALSGGYSYTTICDKLANLQHKINNKESITNILAQVDQLDMSMQHLYILHWIAETLLKDILKCYDFNCTIGRTAKKYYHTYPTATADFDSIMKGVKIRNNIAHSGLIWDPQKITIAIKIYRKYINDISQDQKLNLDTYIIPPSYRELTQEQKIKNQKYIDEKFPQLQMNEKIFKSLIKEITKKLEIQNCKLTEKNIKYYNKKIENTYIDLFCDKYFNLKYWDIKKIIESHVLKDKLQKTFYGIYKNQDSVNFTKELNKFKHNLGIK